MLSRDAGGGARGARRRGACLAAGVRAGARRGARGTRRRACTSPARTSGSAGATRSSGGCGPRASWARATSSPACAPPSRAPACSSPPSAVGYYGPRGDEPVAEDAAPGDDFLAAAVRRLGARGGRGRGARHARRARAHRRSCSTSDGGALARMLPFFRLGVGGPVAGGRQYMPWIHVDDVVGIYLAALDGDDWTRRGQRHGARPGDQQGVLAGARPRAAPAGARAGAGPGDPRALRRDGDDRGDGPARGARARAGARLRLRPPELDEALRSALAT